MINEKILRIVLNNINEAIYITDTNGKIVYANAATTILEKTDLSNIVNKEMGEIIKYTNIDNDIPPSLAVLKTGKARYNENVEWYNKSGDAINAIISTYPIYEDNIIIGSISVCEDVSKLRRHLYELGKFDKKKIKKLSKEYINNGTSYIFDDLIGESKVFEDAIYVAKRFSNRNLPVLIYGETGTGKEMFAQSIHNTSNYGKGQFVAINCSAIPQNLLESILFGTKKGSFTGALDRAGLFEKADKGTLFLDEINSMPMELQAKLLRVLQEREIQRLGDHQVRKINCRILSATSESPQKLMEEGKMRQDLYYRLAGGIVTIPPLRDRKEDLLLLSHHFIERHNRELCMDIHTITTSLIKFFNDYYWPGNVRELANVIESTMNMAQESDQMLDVKHLPPYIKGMFYEHFTDTSDISSIFEMRTDSNQKFMEYSSFDSSRSLKEMVDVYESKIIKLTLSATNGNLTKASEKLGLTRQGLSKKANKLNLDISSFKSSDTK